MEIPDLSPAPSLVSFQSARLDHDVLRMEASSVASSASCPVCQVKSERVHSRYTRRPADLPCFGYRVRLHLAVRRFFCPTPDCPRKIFTERLCGVVGVYARKTERLLSGLRAMVCAAGGEGASELGCVLGARCPPSTLLRQLRQLAIPEAETPRVLGVDDWAMRKGQTYGTILVDLERGHVVDLLPDRQCETLTAWLQDHPGVEIVSRDRAGAYAKAASEGAPEAEQVADRWHLVKNLADAVERVLTRHHRVLEQAAKVDGALSTANESSGSEEGPRPAPESEDAAMATPTLSKAEKLRFERRQRRLERYERVRSLGKAGLSIEQIVGQTGLSRNTVRSYLRGEFPEGRRPNRRGTLEPYRQALTDAWAAGCHDAVELWEKVGRLGFAGSLRTVQRFVKPWRPIPSDSTVVQAAPAAKPPTPRQAVWWLLERRRKLDEHEVRMRDRLFELAPRLAKLAHHAREFQQILRRRSDKPLADWMRETEKRCHDLSGFIEGIRRDQRAVENAITSPWSNGATEGHVNRLKALKRQMYGRAHLDLLRIRLIVKPGHFGLHQKWG